MRMESVSERHKRRLDVHLDRWQEHLPGWAAAALGWLRRPSSRWVRLPIGLFLIGCGVLGFLPILGFWMAIPGLLLVSVDVPFLRLPLRVAIVRVRRAWTRWRQRRRGQGS